MPYFSSLSSCRFKVPNDSPCPGIENAAKSTKRPQEADNRGTSAAIFLSPLRPVIALSEGGLGDSFRPFLGLHPSIPTVLGDVSYHIEGFLLAVVREVTTTGRVEAFLKTWKNWIGSVPRPITMASASTRRSWKRLMSNNWPRWSHRSNQSR